MCARKDGDKVWISGIVCGRVWINTLVHTISILSVIIGVCWLDQHN